MSFHEVRFPANLSFGSMGGPQRRTEVVTLVNGFEERNSPWAHSRRRYDAGVGMRSLDDVEALIAFFEARRGQLHGFRWKDWADFRSCAASKDVHHSDQVIGHGDGVTTGFQLIKAYQSGDHQYQRPIRKPVEGSVTVGLENTALQDGVDFQVDMTTGTVTFETAPFLGAEVSAGYEFDVPVRFNADSIQTSLASFKAGDLPSVPVIEVRI